MMAGVYPRRTRTVPVPAPRHRAAWTGAKTLRSLRDAARQLAIWAMECKVFASMGEYKPEPLDITEVRMLLGDIAHDTGLIEGPMPDWPPHSEADALLDFIHPLQQADNAADVHARISAVIGALASISTNEHAVQALRELKPGRRRLALATIRGMEEAILPYTRQWV
mgnify:CR=1 FL=1